MAYSDNYFVGIHAGWQQRVEASMIAAAVNVSSESTTTANHPNRVVLARNVLNNPSAYTPQFSLATAVNLAVTNPTTPTDAQIDGSVSGLWNGFAGVP